MSCFLSSFICGYCSNKTNCVSQVCNCLGWGLTRRANSGAYSAGLSPLVHSECITNMSVWVDVASYCLYLHFALSLSPAPHAEDLLGFPRDLCIRADPGEPGAWRDLFSVHLLLWFCFSPASGTAVIEPGGSLGLQTEETL